MASRSSAKDVPPPLELECLSALWKLGEGNVAQVRALLRESRPLAYTTVMTLLDRLEKKGVVSRSKSGRSFRYRAEVTRDEMRRLAIRQLVDRLFEGSREELEHFLSVSRDGMPTVLEGGPVDEGSQPPTQSYASLDASLL